MTQDRSLVAVTGANGTIGYACVIHALRAGYRVRCVVRRKSAIADIRRGPSLREYLGRDGNGDERSGKGGEENRVEFAVVSDNTVLGAYDEALKDVQFVVHVAGVWPMPHYNPDTEIYEPFVKSMDNVLEAAKKAGTVRRIVFTQAGAALVNPDDGDMLGTDMKLVLDEHVQPNASLTTLRPPLPSPHHAYCAAKAQCMTHLRAISQRPDNGFPFSIIQVIPGTVIGPSELITTSQEAKEKMDRMSKALLFNAPKPRYLFGFVHVEDCAAVHVNALDEDMGYDEELKKVDWLVAAGTSEVGKNGSEFWEGVAQVVDRDFRDEVEKGVFEVGWDRAPVNVPYRVDSRRTERMVLGGKAMRGFGECVKEVAGWYSGLLKEEEKVN